ncbi:hypothetical protein [Paraconexibacter algicola]|uniref:Uncharacterized protein n=1 Tax=Paraconexibacter algicola TaxID=2133960 RepID=A0A2T4UJX5_9ACTN|nr:hypothetical protein [Paraconexibacter algicola]PTL59540.1 hypothetical protein C7Y72_07710 [Paraconexibacter algicola]
MTTAPEQRIREHLERRGGATEVEVLRLLRTWGHDDPTAADRRDVLRALEGAGIVVHPDLLHAEPGTTMRLTLPEGEPVEDEARGARGGFLAGARARARPRAREEDHRRRDAPAPAAARIEELEPVEIPPELPRVLTTVGATLLMASLFLPWFGADRAGIEVADLSSGWQWLSVLDVLLAVVAVTAVAQLATDALGELGARAVAVAAIVAMAATTARLVSPPDDALSGLTIEVSRKLGPFVALLALAVIVVGAAVRTSPSLSREGTVSLRGQDSGDEPN